MAKPTAKDYEEMRKELSRKSDGGYSYLWLALTFENYDTARMLLKSGVKVNTDGIQDTSEFDHISLLHLAVHSEQIMDILRMLLSKGADVNAQNKVNLTPIYNAATSGNEKMVKILLKHGATISNYPHYVHGAIAGKNLTVVKAFLRHGNVNIKDCNHKGVSALLFSLFVKCEDITAFLLEKGADVHERACGRVADKGQETPLHFASSNGERKNCETMLKMGAAVGPKNKSGITPLHVACTGDIVKILVESGADIHARDLKGRTPLLNASKWGRVCAAEALLKFGADIDATDVKGKTALHFASKNLQVPVLELLLDYGADINICDKKNSIPIKCAISAMDPLQLGLYAGCLQAIVVHIIKLQSAKFSVSQENSNLMQENLGKLGVLEEKGLLKLFRKVFKKEISKLQAKKLKNSNVSFYDLLKKPTISLAVLLSNDSIVQALSDKTKVKEFPYYAKMLETQFRKAMRRKRLVEQCYEFFGHCELPLLPACCLDEIFQYLCNENLQVLVTAREAPRQSSIENEVIDEVSDDSSDEDEVGDAASGEVSDDSFDKEDLAKAIFGFLLDRCALQGGEMSDGEDDE